MSISKQTTGLIVVVVIGLGVYLISNRRHTLTPSHEHARASFIRPLDFSGLGKDFSIAINGVNANSNTARVSNKERAKVKVKFPPLNAQPGTMQQSLMIVPRLEVDGDEAFQWFDARAERSVGWSGSHLSDPQQIGPIEENVTFNLRPGEYIVRYYLEISHIDSEKGKPEKHLLSQSKLIVTGDSEKGIVPLDDAKNKFHVDSE